MSRGSFGAKRSFQECEEYCPDDEDEGDDVVPLQRFVVEDCRRDNCEYRDGDGFLDDLQLHQVEGPAVDLASDVVRGNHEEVFDEGHAPRSENHEDERPVGRNVHFLELEVPVPGRGHEHVADDEEDYSKYSGFHKSSCWSLVISH